MLTKADYEKYSGEAKKYLAVLKANINTNFEYPTK